MFHKARSLLLFAVLLVVIFDSLPGCDSSSEVPDSRTQLKAMSIGRAYAVEIAQNDPEFANWQNVELTSAERMAVESMTKQVYAPKTYTPEQSMRGSRRELMGVNS